MSTFSSTVRSLFAAGAAIAVTPSLAIPSQWEVVDIPRYSSNPSISIAYSINNRNEVVGGSYYYNAANEWSEIGFYWSPATGVQWCPMPLANYNTRCSDISSTGVVTGDASPKNIPGWVKSKALVWRPGVSATLLNPFNSGGDYLARIEGATSTGVFAGRADSKAYRATANGNGVEITPSNGVASTLVVPQSINDSGAVCGQEYRGGEYLGFTAAGNIAIPLPRPNPYNNALLWQFNAYKISNANTVSGETYRAANDYRDLGFILRPGKGYYYYGIGSADDKLVADMNNQDYGVGQGVSEASDLLVPTPTSYTRVPMLTKVDPATPVLDLHLTSINDNMWMCGKRNGDIPVVLRPVSYVTGKVTLQDFLSGPMAQQVIVQFVDPLENTVMEEYGVLLDAQGNYSVKTRNPGAIRIRVKASHWLSRSLIMDFSNNVSGLNFSLINGDVDGDNEVTILDYLAVSKYYEKTSEMSDWKSPDSDGLAPQDADVDGDGEISILDYLIVSGNYEKVGE
jgi:hypothetical protein